MKSTEGEDNFRSYLQFENFNHSPQGFETYSDGLKHPVELRKFFTGELAKEMSVSFRKNSREEFQVLVHPNLHSDVSINSVLKSGICLPKPPKLFKAHTVGDVGASYSVNNNSIRPEAARQTCNNIKIGSVWSKVESNSTSGILEVPDVSEDRVPLMGSSATPAQFSPDQLAPVDKQDLLSSSSRRLSNLTGQQGVYDPEWGAVRFMCRLECGASLASAKGRRKHERKNCPNMNLRSFDEAEESSDYNMMYQNRGATYVGHTLFDDTCNTTPPVPVKKQRRFDCRICGKVLKTYEGRRLHEKFQHNQKASMIASMIKNGSLKPVSAAETPTTSASSAKGGKAGKGKSYSSLSSQKAKALLTKRLRNLRGSQAKSEGAQADEDDEAKTNYQTNKAASDRPEGEQVEDNDDDKSKQESSVTASHHNSQFQDETESEEDVEVVSDGGWAEQE